MKERTKERTTVDMSPRHRDVFVPAGKLHYAQKCTAEIRGTSSATCHIGGYQVSVTKVLCEAAVDIGIFDGRSWPPAPYTPTNPQRPRPDRGTHVV